MHNLNKKFHDLEGKLLVWVSAIYAILSVSSEIFKIDSLQSLYRDPKFFVPALSFFLFLLSRYILSLNDYLKKINENNKQLSLIKKDMLFIRSINEEKEIDRYWNACLLKAEKGTYKLIDGSTILIEKNHAQKFWRRFLVKPELSWFCTDVVKSDEKWGYGWNQETALGFQSYALEEGVNVRRLFIITDNDLFLSNEKEIINMMEAHEKIGVSVKWIAPDHEPNWINLNKFKDQLGTIDFAIADRKYIMAFILDDNLRHTKFILIRNEILAKELQSLYETLWLACNPIFELNSRSKIKKA